MVKKPQASKIVQDDPKRTFKVLGNGDVEVTEVMRNVVTLPSREFTSWIRSHEVEKDEHKKSLSEEVLKKSREEIVKIEKYIKELEPFHKQSEENAKVHYEKEKRDGVIKKIEEEFAKPPAERNNDWLYAVWTNLKENDREIIENGLSDKIKNDFVKVKLEIMKQIRAGKRKK